MKIGIITLWGTKDNYGQVLQAYALQKYLMSRGHDVYHIKYAIKGKNLNEQITELIKHPIKRLKAILKRIFVLNKSIKEGQKFALEHPRGFDEFRNKEIKTYEYNYKGYKEICENPPQADVYITGSDQVWNVEIIKDTLPYFLAFGSPKTTRIAYAVSMGDRQSKDNSYISKLSILLKAFTKVGVREEAGIEICRMANYASAQHVLDPTLLLSADDYLNLIGKPQETDWNADNRLYAYFLNFQTHGDIEWDKIVETARTNNLDLRLTVSSGGLPIYDRLGYKDYYCPTIYQWLQTIHCANYLVTNSFHGIAFAIIFNKQFLYIPLRKASAKMNERIYGLLKELSLESRIWQSQNKDMYKAITETINWEMINQHVEKKRNITNLFFSELSL